MTMKKTLLATFIATLLAAPGAFAAYDADPDVNSAAPDDAADVQTLNVTIPEVALLDISDSDVNLDEAGLHAPTDAGLGFTGTATGSTTYAISSNVSNEDNPKKRKITVAVDTGVGKVPAGARLSVAVAVPVANATAGTAILTNTTLSADSAIDIGNTRESGLNIVYTLDAGDPSGTGMIAHTASNGTVSDNIGLIYTLTDD